MKAKPLTLSLVLTISVLLIASNSIFAGPGRGGPDIDRLTTLLDLNEYQAQQVETILAEQREAMRAGFEAARESGERPDRDAMRAQRETMKAETLEKLGAVLSPEQLEKLEILTESRGQRGGPHRGKPGRGETDAGVEDTDQGPIS